MRGLGWAVGVVVGTSLACGGGKEEGETGSGEGTDVGTVPPLSDEGPTQHPDGPVLTDCEAVCAFHPTGDQFFQWSMGCDVTDPQGVETIQVFGELLIHQGGLEVATAVLACGDGVCSGGFREDGLEDVVISCDDPAAYSFTFVAKDLENHTGVGTAVGEAG